MQKPFFVWQDRALVKIHPEEVICLSTEKNYTRIYLRGKKYYMVRSTLSNTLKKLPADMFVKIHRSIAVSIFQIQFIFRDHLQLQDEEILPISKQFYKPLVNKLNVIE